MHRSLCLEGNELISDSSREVVYYGCAQGLDGRYALLRAAGERLGNSYSEMTAVERRECRSHSPQKWKLLGLGEDMIEPARNPRLRSGGRENKAQPSLDMLR